MNILRFILLNHKIQKMPLLYAIPKNAVASKRMYPMPLVLKPALELSLGT